MEVSTLNEILQKQQEDILALKITLDSLIEELDESDAINISRLEKKIQKRVTKLTEIAKKMQSDLPLMNHYGPIGEA